MQDISDLKSKICLSNEKGFIFKLNLLNPGIMHSGRQQKIRTPLQFFYMVTNFNSQRKVSMCSSPGLVFPGVCGLNLPPLYDVDSSLAFAHRSESINYFFKKTDSLYSLFAFLQTLKSAKYSIFQMFTKMLQRRCLSKKITSVRGKLQPLSAAGCPEVPFVQPKPKTVSKIPVYQKVRI